MSLCFLQHENEIRIPDMVKHGGNIHFEDEFSIKWFHMKVVLLILSTLLYAVCFIIYGMEFGFGPWFTYYSYLNFTFWLIYLTLSLWITTRIYRYVKNNELPRCFQTSRSYQFTTDTDDEDSHDAAHEAGAIVLHSIAVEQLKASVVAKITSLFQYIALVGLWCGAILYWLHEFEVQVYNQSSLGMQFIIVISNIAIQIAAAIEFFMNGFRLKYSGFIWPLLVMVVIIAANMIQIISGQLSGEWNQHLFTELKWKDNVESVVVTVFWSMAILLMVNVAFTFCKNICLCKWSVQQRQKQRYPAAQEVNQVDI
eukprot:173299_1